MRRRTLLQRLLFAAIVPAIVLTGGGEATAHSQKKDTLPPDGASLSRPPDLIAMQFDAPTRVTTISLTSAKGDAIPFEARDGLEPVIRYEAVPPALEPGRYAVTWRGLSDDGHPIEGSFAFTVE